MTHEIVDCIDAGTEYCPCHLAEENQCILCSQLSGKTFCDCTNWKGVCIYQEYYWNGNKAKESRKNYLCTVLEKDTSIKDCIILKILTSHKFSQDLTRPGSYIFVRKPDKNQYYDVPISIMETDTNENWIKIAIEIRGIKTKSISDICVGDNIAVRGPFWNGVFGLNNINKAKDGVSLVIARYIGQAPMVPVLRKLYSNGNSIIAIIDADDQSYFIEKYLKEFDCKIIRCSTLTNGLLSDEFKNIVDDIYKDNAINLAHCDGPDILCMRFVEYVNGRSATSMCNNAKMCCGEGICGSCTVRYKGRIVKRLCKAQIKPENLFEQRRLI